MFKFWRHCARELKRDAFTLYLACKDPRTPWYAKFLAALAIFRRAWLSGTSAVDQSTVNCQSAFRWIYRRDTPPSCAFHGPVCMAAGNTDFVELS